MGTTRLHDDVGNHTGRANSGYIDPILLSIAQTDAASLPTHRWSGTYRTDDGSAEGPVEVHMSIDPKGGKLIASVSVEEGYLRFLQLSGTLDVRTGAIGLRNNDGDIELRVKARLNDDHTRISGIFELVDSDGQEAAGSLSLRVR